MSIIGEVLQKKAAEETDEFVKPVFPSLPSRPVIAEILSFAGYQQEIDNLLDNLSQNSKKFISRDLPILKEFTVVWTPDLE